MRLSPNADVPRAVRLFPSTALRRLVNLHRGACVSAGLDVDAVAAEDDEGVRRWLEGRAGLLPASLADDLERIDELTDDSGADALIGAGSQAGVDVRSLGMDPVEAAVTAFLDNRALFERAHTRRIVEALRRTTEFAGRSRVAPTAIDPSRLRALEAKLGRHFESRERSPHCRIFMGQDGDQLVFTIAHGALVRADEALDGGPTAVREADAPVYFPERTLRYRPQRRDVVVYEGRSGRLRVRAGDAPSLQAYREGFGELLHGATDWFGCGDVVSLEPLIRLGHRVEVPTPGLASVRVVGLIVRYATGAEGTIAIDSDRIWSFLNDRVRPGLDEGELLEVTFRIQREGNPQAVVARVRTPNRVECGKLDDVLFRPFLEARGFLSP